MTDITEYTNNFVMQYGVACNMQVAARILNVSDRTICRMLSDGRLNRIGHRVDVSSIGEYLKNPEAHNFAVRYKNKHGVVPANIEPFDFRAASEKRSLKKAL